MTTTIIDALADAILFACLLVGVFALLFLVTALYEEYKARKTTHEALIEIATTCESCGYRYSALLLNPHSGLWECSDCWDEHVTY